MSPNSKESVIVSPVITVHTLRKKVEIETVSDLTRLLGPMTQPELAKWLRKIFGINGWKIFFAKDCWEVQKGTEEGSVSWDCKDGFRNK